MASPPERPRTYLWDGQGSLQIVHLAPHEAKPASLNRFFRSCKGFKYIGLGAAYDEAHHIEHLAFSSESQVLSIRMNAENETLAQTKSTPEQVRDNLSRVMSDVLGGGKHSFLAFDAEKLAFSLYLDYKITIAGIINLDGLIGNPGTRHKRPLEGKMALFHPGGFKDIDREHLGDAFDERCDDEDWIKRMRFRVSSAWYMQKLHAQSIENATPISTKDMNSAVSDLGYYTSARSDHVSFFSLKELNLLASQWRMDESLESYKPGHVRHEFSEATIHGSGRLDIVQDRYTSRMRARQEGQVGEELNSIYRYYL